MVRDFYRKQSRVTDPGSMIGWLNDLPRDIPILRRIAALTQHDDPPLAKVQALYASEPGLKAPPEVTSFSPAIGEPRTVTIAVQAGWSA